MPEYRLYVISMCRSCYGSMQGADRKHLVRGQISDMRVYCGGIKHAREHGPYTVEAETRDEAETAAMLHFQMDNPKYPNMPWISVGDERPLLVVPAREEQ